ncbi:hypothetical protein GE09DRAFT_1213119 [Coniochaeta sp. 2T2.1]|nr:hypothetical protein GE09DRAFT_1213119 [Coniochaeta sp. 2T2.1]
MPGLWKSTSPAGRPKTAGQQSSIRGRISGPIPIPSPGDDDEFPIRTPGSGIAIPANDDENFEFPIRKPGSGIATTYPLPEEPPPPPEVQETQAHPEQQQLKPPAPPLHTGTPTAASVSGSHTDTTEKSSGNNPEPPPPSQAPPEPPSDRSSSGHRAPARISQRSSPPQRRSPPGQRTTAPPPISALRYSTVSEAPTAQSRDGGGASPKRKKSTLRTALGRLFGRKKKPRDSQGSSPTSGRVTSGMLSATQHRSDPSALSRGNKDGEPKRSASLPITEYDRALRSHSIGPDTITAIESARNSLQATSTNELGGANSPNRKRAATTGGRLFPLHHPASSLRGAAGRASVEGGWAGGLSPRPASTHGRGSRVIPGELEDPSEIGRAITSDSGAGARRKSRSLSGLHDIFAAAAAAGDGGGVPGGEPSQEIRRRSDEIKYWRESYNAGFRSPLSSNAPAEEDGAEKREEQDQEVQDDTKSGIMDESAPQSPVDNNSQTPQEAPLAPKTPPQPFNFEQITRDMVGMKITQAASMDTRLGGLESRMARLERVVDQLCHAVPGFRTPLSETPLGPTSEPSSFAFAFATTTSSVPPDIPAIYQQQALGIRQDTPGSTSSSMHNSSSHFSFGEAQTYIGSLHPPSSSATGTQSLTATAPAGRPTSDATVRGAAGETAHEEEYTAALLSQIDAERLARVDLEAQVAKLSHRLNTLSATMYAMVRSDSGLAKARSQDQLLQPPTPTPRSKSSAEHLHPAKSIPSAPTVVSRFQPEEEEADDDRQTEDEFLTPGEERSTLGGGGGYGFGAFGEPFRVDDEHEEEEEEVETENEREEEPEEEDEGKRKKAARTLSLSQLTLGKRGGQAVQI